MGFVTNDYYYDSGDGNKVSSIEPSKTAVSPVGNNRDWILVFALIVAGGSGWIIGTFTCPL